MIICKINKVLGYPTVFTLNVQGNSSLTIVYILGLNVCACLYLFFSKITVFIVDYNILALFKLYRVTVFYYCLSFFKI